MAENFDRYKWNPQLFRTPEELNAALEQFEVKDKKIKAMEQVYLPGKIRDRIQDLMKSNKVMQAELAARIGVSESSLSRFISGKTDKLGDENIIRIARVFNVSTDFLLGEVDVPGRMNYDISELGLSVQAARTLYTQKVNPQVVKAFPPV